MGRVPQSRYTISLDPRPHFPLHLGKWAWYRLLVYALISPRYLGALDNIVLCSVKLWGASWYNYDITTNGSGLKEVDRKFH